MRSTLLPATALIVLTTPAFSEATRQMDAHEHGVGELNIAFEGNTIAIEFHAPGADIVGFEHAAETAEDKAAIVAAVEVLEKPLDLFVLPAEAGCTATAAHAALEGEHAHDAHDHADSHKHDDHDHAAKHDDHAHDHAHEGHDHDDHADEGGHSEFHAEYALTCANPAALGQIEFAYFAMFPNAREVEVQMVTPTGAQSFEVERDAPVLDLKGLL